MNNKGFAITGIIYGLMLLFVLTVTSFLSILVGRNRRMDELIDGIYETIKYPEINVSLDADGKFNDGTNTSEEKGIYVTPKRGKYNFTDSPCTVYLPRNTVVITKEIKDPNSLIADPTTTLYYKTGGGEDTNEYNKISCLNS